MTFDIGLHEVCVRVGVRYVITKFSRMDSLPNFITHDAPRESSAINVHSTAAVKHGKRNYGITEKETEYEIRERRFQAIDLKKKFRQ